MPQEWIGDSFPLQLPQQLKSRIAKLGRAFRVVPLIYLSSRGISLLRLSRAVADLELGATFCQPKLNRSDKISIFSSTSADKLDPAPTYLMLSKLFTTARSLLDRSSQAIGPELWQTESASEPADEMVTTRGQGGPQAIDKSDAEETARREAPGSSRKRQIPSSDSEDSDSNGDEDIGTPASKKQRVLPVRAKDDKEPKTKTRLVVEIPVRRIRMDHTSQIDTVRKESQNGIPATQDVEKVEDSVSHQSRLEIPDSDFENEVSEVGKNVEAPESSGTGQTENKRHTALPSASKAKHKRFDSEESEVMIFSTAVEKEQSEDESSDDEAPEVVGAHEALEQAQMKEREAAKAIEECVSVLGNLSFTKILTISGGSLHFERNEKKEMQF